MTIKTQTQRGYLQAISGLFITKKNPGGLTPKELDFLAAIIFVGVDKETRAIGPEQKKHISALTNHPIQVVTNYIKKLRDKNVLTQDNKILPILLTDEITIQSQRKSIQDHVQSGSVL